MSISAGDQMTTTEVHERDIIEVPDVPTTTVIMTTTSVTTPPVIIDTELIGMSSPRISLPEVPHHILLLQQHVDQGHGCNNSQRDKLMSLGEEMLAQVNMIHQ